MSTQAHKQSWDWNPGVWLRGPCPEPLHGTSAQRKLVVYIRGSRLNSNHNKNPRVFLMSLIKKNLYLQIFHKDFCKNNSAFVFSQRNSSSDNDKTIPINMCCHIFWQGCKLKQISLSLELLLLLPLFMAALITTHTMRDGGS